MWNPTEEAARWIDPMQRDEIGQGGAIVGIGELGQHAIRLIEQDETRHD